MATTEPTTVAKDNILETTSDDGRILIKIMELVFVPISPALVRKIPGDTNQHGICDIGSTIKEGVTVFTVTIRLLMCLESMEQLLVTST